MTTLLVMVAAVGQLALTPNPDQGSSKQVATAVLREVPEIRREVSDLLQQESAARNDAERARLIRRMTEVYREVVADERFITSPTLQQQRIKMWARLTRVRDEIKRRTAASSRRPQNAAAQEEADRQEQSAAAIAVHFELASQTLGGPAALFSTASGGGAMSDDFSEELIDLIQNTINPSHWNVNGGPGSIVYYRPVHGLVVRATSEVQGRVGDALGGLRDAGR
jgi:hypothetical protein